MSQDVVTARDAAAHPAVSLQFHDAQPICEILNDALAKENYRRAAYSEPTKSLFQLAWAVASHRQSMQVTVYHLAYALICGYPKAGTELAECLRTDAESFAVGCILRLLPLGLSTGDRDIVPTSVDAARWLGEGSGLALKRGRQSELEPVDLVRAVKDDIIPRSVRAQLRAAARLGAARRDAILGPRTEQIVSVAASSPHEIIKQMEEVEKGRAAASSTDDLTNLVELLDDLEQRHSTALDDQKHALARIEALIERRAAPLAESNQPDDVMGMLATIDRRISALNSALPRAPSGARLASAIVAVLVIGVAAGLALTFVQPGSLVAQAISSTMK